jgi:hypothetical protein
VTEWKRKRGGRTHYVQLLPGAVVIGEDTGDRHHDSAVQCTRDDFVAGRYNDVVQRNLGAAALAEILAALTATSAE